MTEPRTPTHHAPLPVLRAAVFAFVGTVLGVGAHRLVAVGPVPWQPGVTAAAVLFGVGLVGARRSRSLAAVVSTCAAAQTGLHLWLTVEHADSAPAMTSVPHMQHGTAAHEAWHERMHASSAMTVAHALAAVLVAVLLHRADTVCWSMAHGLTATIDAVRVRIATARALLEDRPAPAGPRPPGLLLARWERPRPQTAVLTDVVVRRGPPRVGFAPAD